MASVVDIFCQVGIHNWFNQKMNQIIGRNREFKIAYTQRTKNAFFGARQRCNNPHNAKYPRYGQRGIMVLWNNFGEFLKDMGNAPDNMTLDRIDNNGHYCKENCRWATPKEQAINRHSTKWIEFNGVRHTLTEWGEITGIDRRRIKRRLNSGWSIENALTKPVRVSNK